MKLCLALSLALLLGVVASAQDQPATAPAAGDGLHPKVKMETSLGDIVLELDAEHAPITVQNFLRYAADGFYNGTIFHRVLKGFMIQGGGFTPEVDEKQAGLQPPIHNEWYNGLKNERGTIAMARKGWQRGMPEAAKIEMANSATAQFFINVVDNPRLDMAQQDGAAYCVFGKVVEGMDVVDRIRDTKVIVHPKYPSRQPCTPEEAVVIKSVQLIGSCDKSKVEELAAKSNEKIAEYQANPQKFQEEQLAELIQKTEAETGKTFATTDSGLRYIVLQEGNGASPQPTDTVSVHYTGWLVNGAEFDSSVKRGQPAEFPLNGVIKGWTEGVGLMKVGEKRKYIIPPDLAYGPSGRPPTIPGNSYLVFDIELLGIK